MLSNRQRFFKFIAQTSDFPIALEIVDGEGIYLIDKNGNKIVDLVSGVSVSNLGHKNLKIIDAIKTQADKYLHLMVYGEYIQSPQIMFAEKLANLLPKKLNCTYFVNSGSEAVEGALKLAKRYTGRTEIISFKNAYHGSTHGALSVLGDENFKQSFRPLLPDVKTINFNSFEDLEKISEKTACVIIEPIQAEAGVMVPKNEFLDKLRQKCNEKGCLLIFDEIQTGMGRTGYLFAFQRFNVIPDILLTAKALGGGMPLGAFISSAKIMEVFKSNPVLGHITTFGGHPVCCAAGLAAINYIVENKIIESVSEKEKLFRKLLIHKEIKGIYGIGLLLSVELENHEKVKRFVQLAISNQIVTEWFLFEDKRFRISPPLTISLQEIEEICKKINLLLQSL